MKEITQGTVISAVRSEKYAGVNCYAIVINARCDLAQNKANKIYYLIAMPLEKWILSKIGFFATFNKKINEISNSIKQSIQGEGLSWEDMKDFSALDFKMVIESTNLKKTVQQNIISKFNQFIHLKSEELTGIDKVSIIKGNKKYVTDYLSEMSNGKNSNYLILPKNSIKGKSLDESIIVDLKELDYLDLRQAEALIKHKIDAKNIKLSQKDRESYDKKFFVLSEPGYSMIIDEIDSPWIEYIVQHFTNAFTRVGTDNMSKDQIENAICKIIED